MGKCNISSLKPRSHWKCLYLPLISAHRLDEGLSASCHWSPQTGMVAVPHFLQLAEDTELLHEQLQFYLFQALQKCTCIYKRRAPLQQPEQNGNTLGINELELLTSDTSLETWLFRQLPTSYFICNLGHIAPWRIMRIFIITGVINNLKHFINVIYLFFF